MLKIFYDHYSIRNSPTVQLVTVNMPSTQILILKYYLSLKVIRTSVEMDDYKFVAGNMPNEPGTYFHNIKQRIQEQLLELCLKDSKANSKRFILVKDVTI